MPKSGCGRHGADGNPGSRAPDPALKRRLESIKRIHQATDTLEDRIAELDSVEKNLLQQIDALEEIITRVRGNAAAGDRDLMGSPDPRHRNDRKNPRNRGFLLGRGPLTALVAGQLFVLGPELIFVFDVAGSFGMQSTGQT